LLNTAHHLSLKRPNVNLSSMRTRVITNPCSQSARSNAPSRDNPFRSPSAEQSAASGDSSLVVTHAFHANVCVQRWINDCSSQAHHMFSCGHLFCASCVVGGLRSQLSFKPKRSMRQNGNYKNSARTHRLTEDSLSAVLAKRKFVCFLCMQPRWCGCRGARGIRKPGQNQDGMYQRDLGCFIQPLKPIRGKRLCPHSQHKSTCTNCVASAVCKHSKERSLRKECGGSGLCQHGRVRGSCTVCDGSGTCEHGGGKLLCKECCVGKDACRHGISGYNCGECGGKGVCEHFQRRTECTVCKGSIVCEHGNKYYYRHREQKLEYQKKYNKERKEKIKHYNTHYYNKQRVKILAKAKTKVACDCGSEVQLSNLNCHKKTRKHLRLVESNKTLFFCI
jgi:hypothetical protein